MVYLAQASVGQDCFIDAHLRCPKTKATMVTKGLLPVSHVVVHAVFIPYPMHFGLAHQFSTPACIQLGLRLHPAITICKYRHSSETTVTIHSRPRIYRTHAKCSVPRGALMKNTCIILLMDQSYGLVELFDDSPKKHPSIKQLLIKPLKLDAIKRPLALIRNQLRKTKLGNQDAKRARSLSDQREKDGGTTQQQDVNNNLTERRSARKPTKDLLLPRDQQQAITPRQLHPKYWPSFDSMPKFYPINSLRLGIWQSSLHLPDQLFFFIQPGKFTFVVVHPEKQNDPTDTKRGKHDLSLLFNKKKILKYFGSKNPFTTVQEREKMDVDFYGVVTFEVGIEKNIVGMEYSNMLIENSSRMVFEAKQIVKRSFHDLEGFFEFYSLEKRYIYCLGTFGTEEKQHMHSRLGVCSRQVSLEFNGICKIYKLINGRVLQIAAMVARSNRLGFLKSMEIKTL